MGFASACSPEPSERAHPSTCARDAVVAMSDYSSSAAGAVSRDGGVELVFGADLGKDPMLTRARGRTFFLARDLDTIVELHSSCGTPVAKTRAHDETRIAASNPQDVALTRAGAMWIPLYDAAAILVTEGSSQARIDLSAWDVDGNPQASALSIVEIDGREKAFVALEKLDPDFRSRRPSTLLRIDVETRTVEASFDLLGRNPFGLMREDNGHLYWAAPGNFDDAEEEQAGVEMLQPSTGERRMVISERTLGGSVVEVAMANGCGAAIIADPSAKNRTSLVTFDVGTGGLVVTKDVSPLRTEDFDLRGLAWDRDILMVGDRRRDGDGYPIRNFRGCGLAPVDMSVRVTQKPLALLRAERSPSP